MSDINCKQCSRVMGEQTNEGIKLNGKGVTRVVISYKFAPIKFTCRSCSTEYKIENGNIIKDDKATSRSVLDNFSNKNAGRMKKS